MKGKVKHVLNINHVGEELFVMDSRDTEEVKYWLGNLGAAAHLIGHCMHEDQLFDQDDAETLMICATIICEPEYAELAEELRCSFVTRMFYDFARYMMYAEPAAVCKMGEGLDVKSAELDYESVVKSFFTHSGVNRTELIIATCFATEVAHYWMDRVKEGYNYDE